MKLTRRQLGAAIAAAPLLSASPNPQAQPPAPADDLQAARDRLLANAKALAAVPIPMSTEPAVVFKA